jgi:pantoate--beta-alanine ligase
MTADLNLPVQIIGCETLREADGLALSSRNIRLSAAARQIAPMLYKALQDTALALRAGDSTALQRAPDRLRQAGFDSIDYLDLRHGETLLPLDPRAALHHPARLLAAVWLDGVRLIDNIPL